MSHNQCKIPRFFQNFLAFSRIFQDSLGFSVQFLKTKFLLSPIGHILWQLVLTSRKIGRNLWERKNDQIFYSVMEPLVNLCLQQNDLYNPFIDCWTDLGSKDDGFGSKSDGHLREYQSFTDLIFSKGTNVFVNGFHQTHFVDKRLTCIDWHPQIKGIIAVSCAQRVSLYDRIELAPKLLLSPSVILVWSFSDPIHPCLLLQVRALTFSDISI